MGKTLTDILDEVINDICNEYCKYPNIYDPEEHDGVELCDSEICENCPVNRIY